MVIRGIVQRPQAEQVARKKRSYTEAYLRPLLEGYAGEVVRAPKRKERLAATVREREAAD